MAISFEVFYAIPVLKLTFDFIRKQMPLTLIVKKKENYLKENFLPYHSDPLKPPIPRSCFFL